MRAGKRARHARRKREVAALVAEVKEGNPEAMYLLASRYLMGQDVQQVWRPILSCLRAAACQMARAAILTTPALRVWGAMMRGWAPG